MRHEITFGEVEPGRRTFAVPPFGARCVCCNTDPKGRIRRYDVSEDRSLASVEVPVCRDCGDHAFHGSGDTGLQIVGFVVGAALAGGGLFALRTNGGVGIGLTLAGLVIVVAVFAWIALRRRSSAALRANGHHPRMRMRIGYGRTMIATDNDRLADELRALAPKKRKPPGGNRGA